MSQDLPGLDPHPSTSTITYQVLSLVYQGLVDFDRDLKIKPVLAESWKVSPDGRQWTFTLRKGVKFHNGRALTASDVKFSLERILDPKTAARGRGALSIIESVQAIGLKLGAVALCALPVAAAWLALSSALGRSHGRRAAEPPQDDYVAVDMAGPRT